MKPRERSDSSNATMKRIKSQLLSARDHREVLNLLARSTVPLNSNCCCTALHQLAKYCGSPAVLIQIKKDKTWETLLRDCVAGMGDQDVRGICKIWWSFNKLAVCLSATSGSEKAEADIQLLLSAALARTASIAPELDAMGVANCLWGIAKAFSDDRRSSRPAHSPSAILHSLNAAESAHRRRA